MLGAGHPTTHVTAGHLGMALLSLGTEEGSDIERGAELLEVACEGLLACGVLESHFWLRRFRQALGAVAAAGGGDAGAAGGGGAAAGAADGAGGQAAPAAPPQERKRKRR